MSRNNDAVSTLYIVQLWVCIYFMSPKSRLQPSATISPSIFEIVRALSDLFVVSLTYIIVGNYVKDKCSL